MIGISKALKNLGSTPNENPMAVARRLIFVPLLGADGAPNGFDSSGEVNKSAITAKLNAMNLRDRFFPLPETENVESTKGDTVFHEFNSGTKKFVKEGIRHFKGLLVQEHPLFLEKIKAWSGQRFGVYIIDYKGNFIYQTDPETRTKVLPLPVDGNSFVAVANEATDSEVNLITLEFDFSLSAKDELKRYIPAEMLDFDGLNETEVYSLHDVTGEVDQVTAAGFTLKLNTDYGIGVTGLVSEDFTVLNKDTEMPITGAWEEDSDGVYSFAPDSDFMGGESLQVMITKERYDFSAIPALEISIPE
jgi:hypothetical protein